MATYSYDYARAAFANAANGCDPDRLLAEIRACPTFTANVYACDPLPGGGARVKTRTALTTSQLVAVEAIVASTTGEPLIPTLTTRPNGPRTYFDSPIVVSDAFSPGFHAQMVGEDDYGNAFDFSFQGPTSITKTFRWTRPIEIVGGAVFASPRDSAWGPGDRICVGVRHPVPTVTASPGMNGNATQAGSIWVPSDAGDYTLDAAAPVFVGSGGYWSVDYETGELTAAPDGDGNAQILASTTTFDRIYRVPLAGGGRDDFVFSRSSWVPVGAEVVIQVSRASAGVGSVTGRLTIGRPW